MASGEFHCKDCCLFFDSSKSLEVHLQYHKANLMSLWMNSEEKNKNLSLSSETNSKTPITQAVFPYYESRENHQVPNPLTDRFDISQATTISTMESSHIEDSHHYATLKSEHSNDVSNISTGYSGPLSPMDYDYKIEPGLQSPQNSMVPQGPASGPAAPLAYPHPSPGSYFTEYNQQQQYSQPQYGSFHSNYMNGGGYEPQFYERNPVQGRFHPYTVRTPTPTPPGVASTEIKEERLTPNTTPEILDLDSQKVLNSVSSSQANQMGTLPSVGTINRMWRPQESHYNLSNGMPSAPSGLGTGQNLMIQQPTDIVSPQQINSVHAGLGPASNGLSGSMSHSPSGLGPTSTNIGASITTLTHHSSGGLSVPASSMGLAQNSLVAPMHPPLGQSPYMSHNGLSPHPSPANHSPSGFSNNAPMSSFYNVGIGMGSSVTNNHPSQFVNSVPPSAANNRVVDTPPSEYPANVKRAKSFKCEVCNKWFTSHGHLKRHFNTTLHKNMTKANNANPNPNPPNSQPPTPEAPRTPIISPSNKSIGEASSNSNHNDESNLSTDEAQQLETQQLSFNPAGSAFQPPTNYPVGFTTAQSPVLGQMSASLPHYSQSHHTFNHVEQPIPPPAAMYHGHFSTTNPSYPATSVPTPFFPGGNNYIYQHQGGLHGPGFPHVSEFSGPNSGEGFNNFRHMNGDRLNHQLLQNVDPNVATNSPSPPHGDSSENSNDSNLSTQENVPDNFKCNDCSKTFNRMCYLTQHRSTYHEGEKPFKCSTCGKRFMDEDVFHGHQGKHAGEKPYKCEVCPKQFNHKTDLRRHMCLHTGEKPFTCEQCGKGFIRKDHMLKHHQTHRKKALAAAANAGPSHPSGPGFGPHHHGLGPQLPPPSSRHVVY